MQSPREILSDIWTSAGGEASALGALTLTGDEPQLPSSFRVAAAAQASVAATGLAAAEASRRRRPGTRSPVSTRRAMASCACTPTFPITATRSARC
jgi:hypothetical protein